MVKLVNEIPLFAMDQEFMNLFYKKKPTDCILYSEDGIQFKIHREILSQTELMQNILTSAKEYCCQNFEIICPCSKVELGHVVKFLYKGQLNCDSSFDFANILEILTKVFGFPEKFLDEWQEEFEITENIFDLVDLDSIEESISHPINIPLKTKKFKSDDVKQMSQSAKLFKCKNCDAGFMQKINLKRHTKIHEESKLCTERNKKNVKENISAVHKRQKQNLNGINSEFEEVSNGAKVTSVSYRDLSKPKMFYAKLISEALLNSSNGMLILSDIYKSISARHPYYQMNMSGWKNSIRHTLTTNKSFVKSTGKRGSYWKLSENQDEKPYSCGTCDASFNFKASMKRHIATVHEGAKPYKCLFCNRCYAAKINLNGHISKHHRKRLPLV